MPAKMIAERKDIAEEDQWVLTPLFESDQAWEELFSEVEKALERYADYRGHLNETVSLFKEAIEFHLGLTRRIERLYTYAHLKRGGSQFPLDELRGAGVDMGSPEPIKRAIDHFGKLVDQLINVYESI